jgi:hypothetical protein
MKIGDNVIAYNDQFRYNINHTSSHISHQTPAAIVTHHRQPSSTITTSHTSLISHKPPATTL